MQKIIGSLQEVARAVKNSTDLGKAEETIKKARALIKDSKAGKSGEEVLLLEKLDGELGIWQAKLSVLLKEPAGRQGMAKHASYWAEQLMKVEQKG